MQGTVKWKSGIEVVRVLVIVYCSFAELVERWAEVGLAATQKVRVCCATTGL